MSTLTLGILKSNVRKWTTNCSNNGQLVINKVLFIGFLLSFLTACNRQDKANRPSPFTSDTLNLNGHTLSIAYSSPRVRGRAIWDDLVPYHKVWRTGANEATVFQTDVSLRIEGQLLPAGKYSLFTIPTEDSWTIIFNREWNQWGAYSYDSTKDQVRVAVKPNRQREFKEEMTFELREDSILFQWRNLGYELVYETLD